MIKYNSKTINDIDFGTLNMVKVYRGNVICYYKTSGGDSPLPPTPQTPCYAVVPNISQYQDTEFEDVFNMADGKWYKLNNLNEYEEYGVYASGRTECGGETPSRLPSGYTEVEYIENTGTSYIDTNFKANQDTRIKLTAQTVTSQASGKLIGAGAYNRVNAMQFCYEPSSTGSLVVSWGTVAGWTTYSSCIGDYNVHTYDWNKNEFYRDETLIGSVTFDNFQCSDNLGIFRHIQAGDNPSAASYFKGKLFSFQIFDNGTLVRNMIPAMRDSDSKYGLYDIVTNTFHTSPNGNNFVGGNPITPTQCVTTYEGKLTIDDGYEYIYSGGSWVNLGEVSGGTATLPNGYTEVEYIENTGTSASNCAYINTGLKLYDTVGNSFSLSGKVKSEYYSASGENNLQTIINSEGVSSPYYGFVYRYKINSPTIELASNPSNSVALSSTTNSDGSNNIVINCNSITVSDQVPLGLFASYKGNYNTPYRFAKATIYSLSVVKNGTLIADFVPAMRDNDSKYGLYDIVNNTFHTSPNGNNFVGGNAQTIYPMYYAVMQDPPNNISFSSMTEAEEYECPWVGMKATIDGVKYVFSSGYTWELRIISDTITYEAPSKLTETTSTSSGGLHTNAFNTTIKSHTFENGVGTIVFNDDVTSVGDYAFQYCTSLTSIEIPDSVTSIGDYAFFQCSGLTSIDIPNDVTSIGNVAFYNCRSLTSIDIPNSVTSIGYAAFQDCSNLTSVTIPSGVTSIGNSAFYGCSGLTSCTIGSGVTSIGNAAFYNCRSLTSITVEAETPPTLVNTNAFGSTNNCPIYVPSASVNTYKAASGWSNYSSRIQAIA